MRAFNHINAQTLEEASAALKTDGAVAIAGGGDLLGALKDDIFPEYPKLVVNLKSIPDLKYIRVEDDVLKIGALTTLADIARSDAVAEFAPILAQAANGASSPTLRETTTIGGNVCQLPRCWYFRKLGNRFDCARKGGTRCFAMTGDNRYHSVIRAAAFEGCDGAKRSCIAVNNGDLAPALMVLTARFVTTQRVIRHLNFWSVGVLSSTVLEPGEILTEIQIPRTDWAKRSRYKRFTFRKSIDFPVVSVAVAVNSDLSQYHITLGGVAPTPYIAVKAEEVLNGKEITPELAEAAGIAAIEGAKPFEANAYKLQLIKTLVKRELLQLIA